MIGTLNVDDILVEVLSSSVKVVDIQKGFHDNVKDLFIDWIPTSEDKRNAEKLIYQVDAIKHYMKKKTKLLIFDRYRKLSNTEIEFFQKNNVILFEPSIKLRAGFVYLPYWIKIKTLNDLEIDDHERRMTLLYKGDLTKDKIESFRKYYVETAKKYSTDVVCYSTEYYIEKDIDLYYKSIVHPTADSYHDSKFTILIGSNNDYRDGYLDNGFIDALNNNCIPLIPSEHRFYASFKYTSITQDDMNWYNSTDYNTLYLGLLYDIYRNIEEFYPEMNVINVADTIKKYV